jgi:uncharacterized protein
MEYMEILTQPADVTTEKADPLSSLVLRIIQSLVDQTEAVKLEVDHSPSGIVYKVTVASSDVGKIVGKNGRTARALRILLSGMGMKANQRLTLDIVEH